MSAPYVVGQVIERNGRTYTCTGAEPYTNRKGQDLELFRMDSSCIVCGAPFSIKIALSTRYWNWRCPECIAAGVKP